MTSCAPLSLAPVSSSGPGGDAVVGGLSDLGVEDGGGVLLLVRFEK